MAFCRGFFLSFLRGVRAHSTLLCVREREMHKNILVIRDLLGKKRDREKELREKKEKD